jgi:hypothetical protein
MASVERKSSTIGIATALGVGFGFVFELFAGSEIPFGTGIIAGSIVGLLVGNFFRIVFLPWRQRS